MKELAKLTEKCDQKIDGSRQIENAFSIDRNNSPSFRVFVNAIQRSISKFPGLKLFRLKGSGPNAWGLLYD
jgi:hypothetical protein